VHAEGAASLATTATNGRKRRTSLSGARSWTAPQRHWVRPRKDRRYQAYERVRRSIVRQPVAGKVHQHYKESQTLAVAKAKGYIFRGKEVIQTANGPQIRLQFIAR